jgi:murein DD-endopeptidase MepM/ murein hydrolase activator NlpD
MIINPSQVEGDDISLYSYVMNIYKKEYISIEEANKKLEVLKKEYNIISYNNHKIESNEYINNYYNSIKNNFDLEFNDKIDIIENNKSKVELTIEENIINYSSKELSKLNREFNLFNEEINKILKDKDNLYFTFNSLNYDKKDITNIKDDIIKNEEIISYNSEFNNTALGDISKLKRPFNYKTSLTSELGYRINPFGSDIVYHSAVDYAMPINTELYSLFNGVVTLSNDEGYSYGKHIKIDCGNGIIVHYAHLNKRLVEVGDKVTQNQIIGLSGTTGLSTGPHLHLGLYYKGEVLNVEELFK